MPEEKPHRTGLLGKISSRDDAIKTIKQASYVFIVMAIINFAFGILIDLSLIADAILYFILGILLMWLKSRIVSIILLLLSLISLLFFILNKTGVIEEGGSLIGIFVVILLIAAVKAVEGTFKLRGKYKTVENK